MSATDFLSLLTSVLATLVCLMQRAADVHAAVARVCAGAEAEGLVIGCTPIAAEVSSATAGEKQTPASGGGGVIKVRRGTLGTIQAGAFADLIALPTSGTLSRIHEEIVASAAPVSWMMIDGQVIS